MTDLADAIDARAAESQFSGVVRIDRDGETELARAYGDADRAHGIPNTLDTQFAMASGSKAFTALAVMSLVESGVLALDARPRASCSATTSRSSTTASPSRTCSATAPASATTWTRTTRATSPTTSRPSRCTRS